MQNIETEKDSIVFPDFQIHRVTSRKYNHYKEIFHNGLYRNGDQYVLERDYNTSSLEIISTQSEDLMFLLRLFKKGDLVFIQQMINGKDDDLLSQYPYPIVFSNYHSPHHYKISSCDTVAFDGFSKKLLSSSGWGAPWFQIARRFFLWGTTKEFFAGRDDERILDYMIALEALLVFESDFVSRRLSSRVAALVDKPGCDDSKKLIKKFYSVRSALAHGDKISSNDISYTNTKMILFEDIVRGVFQRLLLDCPSKNDDRKLYLSKLYDVNDKEMAELMINRLKTINDTTVLLNFGKKLIQKLLSKYFSLDN